MIESYNVLAYSFDFGGGPSCSVSAKGTFILFHLEVITPMPIDAKGIIEWD